MYLTTWRKSIKMGEVGVEPTLFLCDRFTVCCLRHLDTLTQSVQQEQLEIIMLGFPPNLQVW